MSYEILAVAVIKAPKQPVEEYMTIYDQYVKNMTISTHLAFGEVWKHGNRGHVISVKISCTDCLNPFSKTKVKTRNCFLRGM